MGFPVSSLRRDQNLTYRPKELYLLVSIDMRSRIGTTQKIVESAASLFNENGFGKVSMDQIAVQAEITKMTVYQHFDSKEKLLLQCLQWQLEKREASLDEYLNGKSPSTGQIFELFDWMAQRARKGGYHGCAFMKATDEMAATLPEVRAITRKAKRLLRDRFVGILGSSGVSNPERLGETLALLLEGAQALSLIEQSTGSFKAARREAERLIGFYVIKKREEIIYGGR
jgi:AcrR family transcriptional regulator